MSKIQQDFVVKASGGPAPDWAVDCPINGYVDETTVIPNPLLPTDGWNLLATFQNNSPYTTTFTPSITASSGAYAWDLGDGTILIGDKSISHTYLSTATRTVKLYGKGTCNISTFFASSENIVGVLDVSNSAFSTVTNWGVALNPLMTGIIFPNTIIATITNIQLYSNNLTGALDLSMFNTFGSSTNIEVSSNPLLTGVTFASSVTGTLQGLQLSNCNLTGPLDLSMFNAFTTNSTIITQLNPLLTGITFASSTTGTVSQIAFNGCNLTGVVDLSGFQKLQALNGYNNIHLTGVTFASSFTTTVASIALYNCALSGTLNLSGITVWGSSAILDLYTNPLLTGVTFASSITGTFNRIDIYSCNLTGVLDLSKITAYTANANLQFNLNPALTGVTFASSITGYAGILYIDRCNITGTLDLSGFAAYHPAGTNLFAYSNPNMTNIVFKSSITGFIKTLRIYGCSLGYVNLTMIPTGIALLLFDLYNLSWTAAIVNRVLTEINATAASGFSSRTINIGGTNADPDTTSGGYNGVTARTALQGKAFAVNIV